MNSFKDGTKKIPEWETYRTKIDRVTVAYATSSDAWAEVLITCADAADYFYSICLMDNLIEIDENDFDVTSAFNPKKGKPTEADDDNSAGKYLSRV